MREPISLRSHVREVDWGTVAAWALAFGLVVYLGLEGGGFDPLVHDEVGIAVWWVLLAGVLVGALPRRRPSALAWGALGLFAAFAAWTTLSLGWTESPDKTWAELARAAGYLGVFALALFAQGRRGVRLAVSAVGAGVAVVALVALLSRLQPSWFPEASQTAEFLPSGRGRLSYPLHYWNALAALIAIGLPLLLQVAACARAAPIRGLAAAALPALALTAFLTLGRGGIAAAIVALALFLALTYDRLPKLLTLLAAGAGGAILIAAADRRDALQDGLLTATAQRQGDEMLAIVVGVCATVGLLQAGASLVLRDRGRPGWTRVSARRSLIVATACAAAVLVSAAALDAPGRASDAWTEFKSEEAPGASAGRLESVAGQGRYQLWVAAVDQNATMPLRGTGAGTYEHWWARSGDGATVLDAHSLYLQTLGELGVVGLGLLVAFLLAVLGGGVRAILRSGRRGRPQLAAALAGCVAFCLTVASDWHWQIPVVPVAFLLLAAALVGGGRPRVPGGRGDGSGDGPPEGNRRGSAGRSPAPAWALRLGFAAVALAAIAAIAIPLTSAGLLRQSEAAAREDDLAEALREARTAQDVLPGAAGPRLQQALVLEQLGALRAAAPAARAATEREPTNWRTWVVLARVEAERGRAAAAVRAYRRARSLNPHHSLFER